MVVVLGTKLGTMLEKAYNNDSAISEVIGVILLVAIVTIIASLTALFVFGFLQGVSKPDIISFTVTRIDPQTIEILNNGGPNLADLKTSSNYLTVNINGINSTPINGTMDNTVGSIAYYHASIGSQVQIIGLFNDDQNHMLLEQTV